jgi:ABC-type proline/glycine betaine transport system permease subunit
MALLEVEHWSSSAVTTGIPACTVTEVMNYIISMLNILAFCTIPTTYLFLFIFLLHGVGLQHVQFSFMLTTTGIQNTESLPHL